jgi:hypothetical protein
MLNVRTVNHATTMVLPATYRVRRVPSEMLGGIANEDQGCDILQGIRKRTQPCIFEAQGGELGQSAKCVRKHASDESPSSSESAYRDEAYGGKGAGTPGKVNCLWAPGRVGRALIKGIQGRNMASAACHRSPNTELEVIDPAPPPQASPAPADQRPSTSTAIRRTASQPARRGTLS